MRIKALLAAGAALALATPHSRKVVQTQPATGGTTPVTTPSNSVAASSRPATPVPCQSVSPDESAVEMVAGLNLLPPPPPVEYPGWARRDIRDVGQLNPEERARTRPFR